MASSAAIALVLIAALSGAQQPASSSSAIRRSVPAQPDPRHIFVLDSAHLLTDGEITALQDSARTLQRSTGADIAFVTLPTLHGGPVEDAARTIGRTWKVGSTGTMGDPTRARGLVVLYVPNKSSVAGANLRVEVGQGLEGAITDGGGSRRIIEAMKPGLRAKRYGDGFLAGYTTAAALVRAENAVAARVGPPAAPRDDHTGMSIGLLVALVLLGAASLIVLTAVYRARRTRSVADLRPRAVVVDGAAGPAQLDPPSLRDTAFWSAADPVGSDTSSDTSSDDSFGGGGGFSGGGASDSV